LNRTHFVGVIVAALTATATSQAHGLISRSCGPDPAANTAAVLCAPPSGPCDAATVVLGASIAVKDSDCRFDLGGRALRVERTLQVPGRGGVRTGELRIENAGDITIAKHGRLKARGDFVRRAGSIVQGGKITLQGSGTMRIAGMLDVSGDSAGTMDLEAPGDVVFERSAKIRANGISSLADLGKRYADGGNLRVKSFAGGIVLDGRVQLRGANGAYGGDVDLLSARDLEIRGRVDVSGGGGDGGHVSASAGDDLRILRGAIDARSRGGGADGGTLWLSAGDDWPNDAVPGGAFVIDTVILEASGSANDEGFAGEGGWIDISAFGPVTITSTTIRADGATSPENPDGLGGLIFVVSDGYPRPDDVGGPFPDLDVHIDGRISARGGRRGGEGGSVELYVGRDLDLEATIDVGGKDVAGLVVADAGRHLHLGKTLAAEVERPHADGAIVVLTAGSRQVGGLTIAADVLATGGTDAFYGPTVTLTGCPIAVADGVPIAAGGSIRPGGLPARLDFISGRPAELGAGSRYLAGPSGMVTATHPPLQAPVFGAGTSFDPAALVDVVMSPFLFPNCPRCGDGPGDACAPEARIDAIVPAAGVIDATVAVSSPLGLALAGSVDVCDGTGVEDLTFTWLAISCNEADTLELAVNDTVVFSDDTPSGICDCGFGGERSYTVPQDELPSLLAPGPNRLGILKSTGLPAELRTQLFWAYATITVNGVSERVSLFDPPASSDPFGTTHLDQLDRCHLHPAIEAVDASRTVLLCSAVASVPWSGALPCGLDLSPLETDRDYTLVVRATDGAVEPASAAARDFTRGTEDLLSVNGAHCP
jgi:hypothetical protein